jgi:thiol:disulfide interchange protein
MERFRRLMSVPMFLTALALAWVLGRQAGVDGMALGLAAALVLALTLWWLGRRQGTGSAWLPLAPAALAACAAILLVPTATEPAMAAAQGPLKAEPFSEARLAALRQSGRPTFVYFTADWCVTCKVNEKGALEREEVAQGVQESQRRRPGWRLDARRSRHRPFPRTAWPLRRAALSLLRAGPGRARAAASAHPRHPHPDRQLKELRT